MSGDKLVAICEAIKTGFWNQEQLTLQEFEAIHAAVGIVRRRLAIELLNDERRYLKQHAEALAAKV